MTEKQLPESEWARRARARVEAEGGEYVDRRAETGKRGYQWPPFQAGNELQRKHGATMPKVVDPVASGLVEGLLQRRGDLVKYPEALHAWARAEARCLLLADWFAEHGLTTRRASRPRARSC